MEWSCTHRFDEPVTWRGCIPWAKAVHKPSHLRVIRILSKTSVTSAIVGRNRVPNSTPRLWWRQYTMNRAAPVWLITAAQPAPTMP